jgi:hypothetical protein
MRITTVAIAAITLLLALMYAVGRYKSMDEYKRNISEIETIISVNGSVKPKYEVVSHRLQLGEYYIPYWLVTFKDMNARRGFGSCSWYYFSDRGGISSIHY